MIKDSHERKTPLILVVDDELIGRLYTKKALQSEGYDVITAENGQKAVTSVAEYSPNMIVMDVIMPVMDGYQASIAIREQEHKFKIPILMLTGLEDTESVEKAFDSGATDFIVKPINLPIFKQRVRNGLKTFNTSLELYKNQLRQSQAHRMARIGYWDWDVEKDYQYWSEEVYELVGVDSYKFENNSAAFLEMVHPDDCEKVKQAVLFSLKHNIPFDVEHRIDHPDKKLQVVHQHAELIINAEGKVSHMLGVVQDITEQHIAQEKIHHQAYYDNLTNLPNRTLFKDRLAHALAIPGHTQEEIAVLVVNLDRFKNINDSLGLEVGDKFLQSVTESLRNVTQKANTLARLGGDEFSLILEGVTSKDDVIGIAQELLEILSNPHIVNDHELISTGSIGIAISSMSSEDENEKEDLIKQADLAMNRAKETGGNQFCFYNEEMKSEALQSLVLEKDLRGALGNNELEIYYQPKVCVETGIIKGMEALIRWNHPERGLVPPFEFIPIAEKTGLIIPIGRWVLEEACKQTMQWHMKGYDNLKISVNVSVKQFNHQIFIDEVCSALEGSGIDSKHVDLEITESCTMNNIDTSIHLLETIKNMGISISMDDFGTGFSSLSYLNQLPLTTLKIDRAFIKDIDANGKNGELAKLIITVAKSLQLNVVAEGVETSDHLNFLRTNGCDEYQGFYLSPPVPAKQFEELLINNNQEQNELVFET